MNVTHHLLICALLGAAPLAAQIGPEETIRKILDEVGQEMREIDRLLLQSSRQPATEGMERNVERLRELMDQTGESQGRVVRGLDQLIEELQKMQQQSRGSGSQQDQQGQPQQDGQPQEGQQQGQQQQGERQQTETPDLVRQGQQQEGQQPQPEGQQPQDGRDPQDMGENRPAGPATEDGEEQVQRDAAAEGWGDLPKYIQFLHTRGGVPEVPEKYRRAYEAYQRRANQQGNTRPR